jgi:hypothetical protein
MNWWNNVEHKYEYIPGDYPETRTFWRGNSVVEDVSGVNISGKMENGNMVETHVPVHVFDLFFYLPHHSYYKYRNLSDTSQLLAQHPIPDSKIFGGGWNFCMKNVKYSDDSKLEAILPDTIIEGVCYKRARFSYTKILLPRERGVVPGKFIGYYRCDKKWPRFQLAGGPSVFPAYPLMRIEEIADTDSLPYNQISIILVSDTISKRENSIIDAWEKYAKKHRVSKSDTARESLY